MMTRFLERQQRAMQLSSQRFMPGGLTDAEAAELAAIEAEIAEENGAAVKRFLAQIGSPRSGKNDRVRSMSNLAEYTT